MYNVCIGHYHHFCKIVESVVILVIILISILIFVTRNSVSLSMLICQLHKVDDPIKYININMYIMLLSYILSLYQDSFHKKISHEDFVVYFDHSVYQLIHPNNEQFQASILTLIHYFHNCIFVIYDTFLTVINLFFFQVSCSLIIHNTALTSLTVLQCTSY